MKHFVALVVGLLAALGPLALASDFAVTQSAATLSASGPTPQGLPLCC